MGSMFVDEPGLEMDPNWDRQADLLMGLESVKVGDFQRVQNLLLARDEAVLIQPEPRAMQANEGARRLASHAEHPQLTLNVSDVPPEFRIG